MVKKPKQPRLPLVTVTEDFAQKVRMVFQNVAESCGSDILQYCMDMGYPAVIEREGLYDYLDFHGGPHGREVQKWLYDFPGDHKDLNRALNAMKVPKTWV